MRTLLDATALDDVSEACHYWRNFALESGGDHWRRQDLVSGGWDDDRGAEGASIEAQRRRVGWGMGKGVRSPAD